MLQPGVGFSPSVIRAMGASFGHDEDSCAGCGGVEDWLPCAGIGSSSSSPSSTAASRKTARRAKVSQERLEELTQELFQLHDLNGDGFLDEAELVQLNVLVAIMHQGNDANMGTVRQKYQDVFRDKLDPRGRPVPYEVFRSYTREVLDALDTDPRAQEMILEQFVAEAQSCRQVFSGTQLSTTLCCQVPTSCATSCTVPTTAAASSSQSRATSSSGHTAGGGVTATQLQPAGGQRSQSTQAWVSCPGLAPPQVTPARSLVPQPMPYVVR